MKLRWLRVVKVWAVSIRGGKEYTRPEIAEITTKAHEMLASICLKNGGNTCAR